MVWFRKVAKKTLKSYKKYFCLSLLPDYCCIDPIDIKVLYMQTRYLLYEFLKF